MMTLAQLAISLDIDAQRFLGSTEQSLGKFGPLDDPTSRVSFCKWPDERGRSAVLRSSATVVFVPEEADESWRRPDTTLVPTPNPRRTFILALDLALGPPVVTAGIHPTAVVDSTAVIDSTAEVTAGCYIGPRCVVGPAVVLHPHVVLMEDVHIGLGSVVFGGTVIGSDGFGYERDEDGSVLKFRHIGGVRIGMNVEVGANTCIDRGSLGHTTIDDDARIDNLVHIAHNVHVGRGAFVIALAMIGGSTDIADGAWIAPGAVLRNAITIGPRATVGLGAVVTRSVPADEIVLGNPARPRAIQSPKP
jgi:UDP-3-O-[3-hydroxymyristoyl] glucosamine N-acyltransferase